MPSEMPKPKIGVDVSSHRLWVELPLNKGSVRVKRKIDTSVFGASVKACSKPLRKEDCNFIEWQIGYDLPVKTGKARSTLFNKPFPGSAGKQKIPGELSEIVFWAHEFGFLTDAEIRKTKKALDGETEFLDSLVPIPARRPETETRNGFSFGRIDVSLPVLVSDFGCFKVVVSIQKQQYGSSVQPMLYFCIPISAGNGKLQFRYPAFDRKPETADEKICDWNIGKDEAGKCLDAFRLLGMLSSRHNKDTCQILQTLFPDLGPATLD